MGLNDFESGKSLTIGLDYKKENKEDIDKFFEMKIYGSQQSRIVDINYDFLKGILSLKLKLILNKNFSKNIKIVP